MDERTKELIELLEKRKANCERDPLEDWIREYVAEHHPWNEGALVQRANEIKATRQLAMESMDREIESLNGGR